MSILNNIKPLSRLSSLYLTKVWFRHCSSVPRICNRCQNLAWRSPVFVSAHQRHSVFFRRLSDSDGDLNHLYKDDLPRDRGSAGQGETERGTPETFSLDVLVALLRQENALDICVVKIPGQTKYAEYFVVVSGLSTRHLKAMALYTIKVYKYLKQSHESHVKIEGRNTDDWMCIDFGNIVVHYMLPEAREIYELEKLWTLRSFDEQLRSMPVETLPEDFIFDLDVSK